MKKSELKNIIKEELDSILNEGTMKLNLGDSNDTLLVKIPTQSFFQLIQKHRGDQRIMIDPDDVDLFIGALKRIK